MNTHDYTDFTIEELRAETLRLVGDRHYLIQDWVKENPDDLDHLASAVLAIDDQMKAVERAIYEKLGLDRK